MSSTMKVCPKISSVVGSDHISLRALVYSTDRYTVPPKILPYPLSSLHRNHMSFGITFFHYDPTISITPICQVFSLLGLRCKLSSRDLRRNRGFSARLSRRCSTPSSQTRHRPKNASFLEIIILSMTVSMLSYWTWQPQGSKSDCINKQGVSSPFL